MSEGEHIKIFDPPLEQHHGNQGYYVHSLDSLNTTYSDETAIAASYVGYIVENALVYQYPPRNPDGSEQPDTKYVVLPLHVKPDDPDILKEHECRGISSVIRVIIYFAGKKLFDEYSFRLTAEDDVETVESVTLRRVAVMNIANTMLQQRLIAGNESNEQRPEAA